MAPTSCATPRQLAGAIARTNEKASAVGLLRLVNVLRKGAGPSGTFPPKSFPEGPTQAGVRRPALWDRIANHGWRPELLVTTLHPIPTASRPCDHSAC